MSVPDVSTAPVVIQPQSASLVKDVHGRGVTNTNEVSSILLRILN